MAVSDSKRAPLCSRCHLDRTYYGICSACQSADLRWKIENTPLDEPTGRGRYGRTAPAVPKET